MGVTEFAFEIRGTRCSGARRICKRNYNRDYDASVMTHALPRTSWHEDSNDTVEL